MTRGLGGDRDGADGHTAVSVFTAKGKRDAGTAAGGTWQRERRVWVKRGGKSSVMGVKGPWDAWS